MKMVRSTLTKFKIEKGLDQIHPGSESGGTEGEGEGEGGGERYFEGIKRLATKKQGGFLNM